LVSTELFHTAAFVTLMINGLRETWPAVAALKPNAEHRPAHGISSVDFAVSSGKSKRGAALVRRYLVGRQGIGWRALMTSQDYQGGALLRPWLPISWINRLIALAIVALGAREAWIGNYPLLIWWLTLPFFSPRFMGECANVLGFLGQL
jgi:hypothetical protein